MGGAGLGRVLPPVIDLCLHGLDGLLRQSGVGGGNSGPALRAFEPTSPRGRHSAEFFCTHWCLLVQWTCRRFSGAFRQISGHHSNRR
jgi:hypothetical protein